MAQPAVDFTAQLHSQGYRLTPQRQLILETVRRAGDHVTPEEVYQRVHRRNPAVSRATIYRTLEFLCELRLIHAMYWGGQMYYEIAGAELHHHLVCRVCGAIEQIDHVLLDDLFQAIEQKHRFAIDMEHVALFGLCRHCRADLQKAGRRSKK
jgi:Fur family ferric uptake transcriptional regulator